MINWQDLLTAVALVLVLEGIFPFLTPGGLRRALAMLQALNDTQFRRMGVTSMLAGLVLLYFVKQ